MQSGDTQTPQSYEIVVLGRIDPGRAVWFGELVLQATRLEDGQAATRLSGCLPDQSALFGVLNRIRDLGLKLVSVNLTTETIL